MLKGMGNWVSTSVEGKCLSSSRIVFTTTKKQEGRPEPPPILCSLLVSSLVTGHFTCRLSIGVGST